MSWSLPEIAAIADLVGRRTGLAFGPGRQESAEQGVRRAMARARTDNPAAYLERLAAEDNLLDDLIVELTVGETYFFREPGQFQFIGQEILPEVRRRRGPEYLFRAWSAACATGEEPYSLAILLDQEHLLDRSHILATDISRAALARALEAVYGVWSLRGEGVARVRPYLTEAGGRFKLRDRIRRSVTFEYLNLALDAYPSFATGTWGLDLILCRNVLIYFGADTVRAVARRLFEALTPGGWLLTAASDPPLGDLAPWETVVTDQGVFYRRPGAFQEEEHRRPPSKEPVFLTPAGPDSFPWEGPEKSPDPLPAVEGLELAVPPGVPPSAGSEDPLEEAGRALTEGDYARVVRLTEGLPSEERAAVLHVRALANLDTAAAERSCAGAARQHPLSAELSFLHAVLLTELGRTKEAIRAMRRVLYLDRTLAVGHFTLGTLLARNGDPEGARRAFRNARDLCAALPPDQELPLADGERAGALAEAAKFQADFLEAEVR